MAKKRDVFEATTLAEDAWLFGYQSRLQGVPISVSLREYPDDQQFREAWEQGWLKADSKRIHS